LNAVKTQIPDKPEKLSGAMGIWRAAADIFFRQAGKCRIMKTEQKIPDSQDFQGLFHPWS
jgi:hypothetical protein